MSETTVPPPSDSTLQGQLGEVHDSFVSALVNAGVMGKLRAQLRAAALGILRDDRGVLSTLGATDVSKFSLSHKAAILLIDEFLSLNRYQHSLGIFHEESNAAALQDERPTLVEPLRRVVGARTVGAPSKSLLESLLEAVMTLPLSGETTHASADVRSRSPDIEAPSIARLQQPATATLPPKASSEDSATGSRRGSSAALTTAVAPPTVDTLENSVEYSDRSANSSLDLATCDAVERIASAATAGAPSSSDDDF